jgi:septum formation protein
MLLSRENVLVLGSASPRRTELLTQAGIPHAIVVPSVDESVHPGETTSAYLLRVVRSKLDAVRAAMPAPLAATAAALLCADTSVIVDDQILGKPETAAEGRAMLLRLRGRAHEVRTAFAIGDLRGALLHEESVSTRVIFRDLTDREMDDYVAHEEGRDKAGGYAMQGAAGCFVARIEGSPTNVIGLPTCEVVVALQRLGLR